MTNLKLKRNRAKQKHHKKSRNDVAGFFFVSDPGGNDDILNEFPDRLSSGGDSQMKLHRKGRDVGQMWGKVT